MENLLEAVILGGEHDENIEYVIVDNILIDRDHNNIMQPVNRFDLDELSDTDIKLNFRFERNDIKRLLRVLALPSEIRTPTQHKITGLTALCIVLRRLAYPNRLSDICHIFCLSPQSMSQIINKTVELIVESHGRLLNNLNELGWLNQERLQTYAQAVQDKGGAIHNCWGFIDETARQICRPTVQQEEYYSGHKRNHCVKYQSVLCPDGVISRLYEQLERKVVFNDEEKYTLYGDQAYGLRELLLCPYPGRPQNLPEYQRQFNNSLKVLRVTVEWGFQKIVSEFAYADFKKNQKLLLQDVEALYKTAVILTNCHTCLYGSHTANYFNIGPPSLEEYFGM